MSKSGSQLSECVLVHSLQQMYACEASRLLGHWKLFQFDAIARLMHWPELNTLCCGLGSSEGDSET